MSDVANKAVFLSYASQDTEAAKKICDALRAAGVEVWFDQNELVGGDAWDAKIRKQIKECALLIPVISQNTQARTEGYFRLEWRLADQRTHLMAKGRPFLLPVVIDGTRDAEAHVPDSFTEVQWTQLPGGETPAAFGERVKNLLSPESDVGRGRRTPPFSDVPLKPAGFGDPALQPKSKSNRAWLGSALAGVALMVAVGFWQPWKKAEPAPAANAPGPSATSPAPPTEAQKLVAQAKALMFGDPMRVRENFRAASELCERATTLSPENAEAWATYAEATCTLIFDYNEQTDKLVAAARSQAERAIRLAPNSIESGLAMARFDAAVGAGPAAAESRLRTLLERAPNERRILELLAFVTGDIIENVDQCREWAERADALPGGSVLALEQLAWAYWGTNRFRELEAVLDRIFARQPTSVAHHLKLMVLWAWGDLDGVLAWLETTPAAVLVEDRAASIAVETYQIKRQPEKALALLARIPREFLQEGRYLAPKSYLVGQLLQSSGKHRAAEVEFRSALKSVDERLAANPHDGHLFNWKGRVLAKLGDKTEAARQFETGRELGAVSTVRISAADMVLVGRYDEAIAEADSQLKRERSRWPSFFTQLKFGPEYEPLRSDPRFQALLARGQTWLEEMRLVPATRAAATMKADEKSAAADKSVAVLAFDNRSDDKEAEYFSDGVSDELITALQRVPGLMVKGRTSAFYFKGKQVKSEEIGRQLGVAYLVRGSVRKAGNNVRITAELTLAATDEVVWSSEPIAKELKDMLAVQEEIAGLIAKNLSVKMGVAARPSRQVSPDAFTALSEGRHYWSLRSSDGLARAEALFTRAATLEPDWAPVQEALGDLWVIGALYRGLSGEPFDEERRRGQAAARRALELDPSLAQPHATLGLAATLVKSRPDWAEAERELRRAIELAPSNATAHNWYGDVLQESGRMDLAIEEYRKAAQLDPLALFILSDLGWKLVNARRYEEALQVLDRADTLYPGRVRIVMQRAEALVGAGRQEQARAGVRTVVSALMKGEDIYRSAEAVHLMRQLGLDAEAGAVAQTLLAQHPHNHFLRGALLLGAGRLDEALALLEKPPVFVNRFLFYDPQFDAVRGDPRWTNLMEKRECAAEYHSARDSLARSFKESVRSK